jgi:hypothetical protein
MATIEREAVIRLLRRAEGEIPKRCLQSLDPLGDPLLLTRQTASSFAKTLEGKYNQAIDRGHSVEGLGDVLSKLRHMPDGAVRAVLVETPNTYWTVVLDEVASRVLAILEVRPLK